MPCGKFWKSWLKWRPCCRVARGRGISVKHRSNHFFKRKSQCLCIFCKYRMNEIAGSFHLCGKKPLFNRLNECYVNFSRNTTYAKILSIFCFVSFGPVYSLIWWTAPSFRVDGLWTFPRNRNTLCVFCPPLFEFLKKKTWFSDLNKWMNSAHSSGKKHAFNEWSKKKNIR